MTAFISHHGLCQFLRMPSGLKNDPATIQSVRFLNSICLVRDRLNPFTVMVSLWQNPFESPRRISNVFPSLLDCSFFCVQAHIYVYTQILLLINYIRHL